MTVTNAAVVVQPRWSELDLSHSADTVVYKEDVWLVGLDLSPKASNGAYFYDPRGCLVLKANSSKDLQLHRQLDALEWPLANWSKRHGNPPPIRITDAPDAAYAPGLPKRPVRAFLLRWGSWLRY